MLALEKMSRPEKMRMMEALWVDLTRDEQAMPSPEWHAQALEAAQRAHAAGEAEFVDWKQAKQALRREP